MDLRPDQFSLSQKAQLALRVFIIYWPIRLYLNIYAISWPFVLGVLPLWGIEIPLTIFFFFCWISLTQWLLNRFQLWSGALTNAWTQLGLLVVASMMAVLFNLIFNEIRTTLDESLQPRSSVAQERVNTTLASPGQLHRRGGSEQRQRTNTGITVMAMLSAFYLVVNRRSSTRLRELEVQAERMEKETAQAQFMALKNQVNPHFLFNSLSILSSLVEVDSTLSVRFINQLSRAYRYILEQRDNERVSLRTELEFIQAYIFLLSIRFEDKLQVTINVTESEANQYAIAPLTLQLLVENAVKHNQMSASQPLIVSIYREHDYLLVTNPVQLRPTTDTSTGVGLQNIINRYALLTDKPVWVGEQDGLFVVKIPLLP
ncbi:MAG: sensor histidine kinase [Gemmataceae bacterium]